MQTKLSLPDMLTLVPHLLATCSLQAGVKLLRILSKEIDGLAMGAVKSCSVKIGTGTALHAEVPILSQRMINLMSLSNLLTLDVIIITTTDGNGPSVLTQLATMISQVDEVLLSMGNAIQTVRNLKITFVQESTASKKPKVAPCGATLKPFKLASFSVLSHTICTILAEAVPMLESLAVAGTCVDVAMGAFGGMCPQLACLKLEAISVAEGALKDIGKLLPRLTSFYLMPPSARPPHARQLEQYVGACLLLLRACPLLTQLGLDLSARKFYLENDPSVWMLVPEGVLDLTFLSQASCISHCPALLSHLHRLTISSNSTAEALRFLSLVPSLQQISTTGEARLQCDRKDELVEIPLLQEHMDSKGFVFTASFHRLKGSGKSVQEVLEMLPILSSKKAAVVRCTLDFSTSPGVHCLAQFARVFPYLTTLQLEGIFPGQEGAGVDAALLAPLAACTSLSRLMVHTQVDNTTASLVDLCMSIPSLMMLRYMPSEGVDTLQLKAALKTPIHSVMILPF